MKKIILLCFSVILGSCSSSETSSQIVTNDNTSNNSTNNNQNNNQNSGNDPDFWSIPVDEVIDGGPGKDGIPAIANPDFLSADDADQAGYLENDDLVLIFKDGLDISAYPHAILDWHEIVNDEVGTYKLAITFCPLTGTGIGWDRNLDGEETTFGVSGLLYNTNLIPYDRKTDSNWSQILNECVNGNLVGELPKTYQLLETNWETAKALYPKIKVLGTNTGFERPYGNSPYLDYNTNNDLFLFPVPKDTRLPLKEKVLAIMDDGFARAYQFSSFTNSNLIRESFRGKDYLIVGNSNFMFAYDITTGFENVEFTYVLGNPDLAEDVVLSDNQGNLWDAFGVAVEGPRTGDKIAATNAMMGMWFSIPAFYNTSIFQ